MYISLSVRYSNPYHGFVKKVAVYKEAISPVIPNGEVKIITTNIIRTQSLVGSQLANILFTDGIGYVPCVVTTILFPFHECDLPNENYNRGVLKLPAQRVSHVGKNLLTRPEHLRSL